MSTSYPKRDIYKEIKRNQDRHDELHEQKKKNKKIGLNEDISCWRCYKPTPNPGERFLNFKKIFVELFDADENKYSQNAVNAFNEIIKLNIGKETDKFIKEFRKLSVSFRYTKEWEMENGERDTAFVQVMGFSEKFNLSFDETIENYKKHYSFDWEKEDEGEFNDTESFHGSVISDDGEIIPMSGTLIDIKKNHYRIVFGKYVINIGGPLGKSIINQNIQSKEQDEREKIVKDILKMMKYNEEEVKNIFKGKVLQDYEKEIKEGKIVKIEKWDTIRIQDWYRQAKELDFEPLQAEHEGYYEFTARKKEEPKKEETSYERIEFTEGTEESKNEKDKEEWDKWQKLIDKQIRHWNQHIHEWEIAEVDFSCEKCYPINKVRGTDEVEKFMSWYQEQTKFTKYSLMTIENVDKLIKGECKEELLQNVIESFMYEKEPEVRMEELKHLIKLVLEKSDRFKKTEDEIKEIVKEYHKELLEGNKDDKEDELVTSPKEETITEEMEYDEEWKKKIREKIIQEEKFEASQKELEEIMKILVEFKEEGYRIDAMSLEEKDGKFSFKVFKEEKVDEDKDDENDNGDTTDEENIIKGTENDSSENNSDFEFEIEIENNKMAKIVKFKTFSGKDDEDVNEWFNEFERKCLANGIRAEDGITGDKDKRVATLIGLLEGEAADWYEGLSNDYKGEDVRYKDNSNNDIVKALKEKFTGGIQKIKTRQEFRNLRQEVDENVEKYYRRWLKLEKLIGDAMNDEFKKETFIYGLLPGYMKLIDDTKNTKEIMEQVKKIELRTNVYEERRKENEGKDSNKNFRNVIIEEEVKKVTSEEMDDLTNMFSKMEINLLEKIDKKLNYKKNYDNGGKNNQRRQNYNGNNNYYNNIECYHCGKKGHIRPNCPEMDQDGNNDRNNDRRRNNNEGRNNGRNENNSRRNNNGNNNNGRSLNLMNKNNRFKEENSQRGIYENRSGKKRKTGPESESRIENELRTSNPLQKAHENRRKKNKCPKCKNVGHFSTECLNISEEERRKIKERNLKNKERKSQGRKYEIISEITKGVPEFDIMEYFKNSPCGLSVGQMCKRDKNYAREFFKVLPERRRVEFGSQMETNYIGKTEGNQTLSMFCKGNIDVKDIYVTIDTGACESAISTKIVEDLGLKIDRNNRNTFDTANGEMKSEGKVYGLQVFLEGQEIRMDFNVIKSNSDKLLLGMDWTVNNVIDIHIKDKIMDVEGKKGEILEIPIEFEEELSDYDKYESGDDNDEWSDGEDNDNDEN